MSLKQEIILTTKTLFTTCAFIFCLIGGFVIYHNITSLKYLGLIGYYIAGVCLYIVVRGYFKMHEELVNYKLKGENTSVTN
jgi:hypothetical protein